MSVGSPQRRALDQARANLRDKHKLTEGGLDDLIRRVTSEKGVYDAKAWEGRRRGPYMHVVVDAQVTRDVCDNLHEIFRVSGNIPFTLSSITPPWNILQP